MASMRDLQEAVASAVAARRPVDEREAAAIPRFLEQLARLPAPFSETADPVHVTASAIVVGVRGVLLHKHKRLGIWLQPGGHIEPDEAPGAAALRETEEETGLTVVHAAGEPTLVHVDVHPGPRGHTHLDLRYLLIGGTEDPRPPEGESPEAGWFAWDAARRLTDAGLAGALAALQPVSSSTVRIRAAQPADGPALAELYLRSRRHGLPTVRQVHPDNETRRWLRDVLLEQGDVWVAEVAGVVVGILALSGESIEQLYLDPPWLGRGIGTLLIDHAKARSPHRLEAWTFQVNRAGREFYLRRGFHEIEVTDGAGNEEQEPDVRVVWTGGRSAQ